MIDLTIIATMISPIIVIACLAIGFVITKTVDSLGKGEIITYFIPIIMLILGIVFNVWYVGAFTLEVCVAGGISGLASTGLYEAFDQMLNLSQYTRGKHAKVEVQEEE